MEKLNLIFGWAMVLAGFISGAVIGMKSKDDGWLGGYVAVARRHARLGHIACVALGFLNILVWLIFTLAGNVDPESGLSALPGLAGLANQHRIILSSLFIAGGILMPLICFLTAGNNKFSTLFPIPTLILIVAAGWMFLLLI